ncbi:MAG TPA: DNA repair protein RecO [Candidatus Copromorpha excrementipullorum]|uniref:DNA repair protein RecO n=1 Tax=Candidatus Allocopromorpha excrementipullorum TaxID=2840743 RepID=A0A9D1N7M9_9FIRM|nr:DNA repair protein RecO [Candidatus Copromorpha excrementipullorum]
MGDLLTDTEGIVLRQVKTSYGRRMILLFSKKYGKISAGTGLNERGKGKSSLALRPFTYGRYELFKNRDSYNINGAEVLKSYYGIGEDVDKYMNGAYVLEFTERVLAEEVPSPGIFSLLIDFFDLLENRDKGIGTLVLAYQTKVFRYTGVMPQLERCAICGEEKPAFKFSVEEGGVICRDCFQAMENLGPHALIYDIKFGILDILKYFTVNPLKKLENIALKEDAGKLLQEIIREYAAYYLDVSDLKSEKLI